MKTTLILTMIIASTFVSSQTIKTYYPGFENSPSADYFYVSSFMKELKHCYNGPTEGLCAEIKKGESITRKNYSEGDHDYFEIVSCSNDHDEYTVKTKLYDDYGTDGEELVSVFGQCD